jgi:hypothetical protein
MFKAKLINSLKASTAWTEFADALQSLNEQVLEPMLDRLKGMTSVFTMHADDLQVRFNELGAFFSTGRTEDEDVPLLLQQRTDEIHYKGYDYPLSKTFEREFLGISLSWEPLYAPKDLDKYPYGSKFLLLTDIESFELNKDDYFKTYRGVIFTILDDIYNTFGSIDDFELLLDRVVLPLIPTHIAFSGKQYSIASTFYDKRYQVTMARSPSVDGYTLVDRPSTLSLPTVSMVVDGIAPEIMTVTGSKIATYDLVTFDDFALDSIPLDINSIQGNM